MEGYCWLRALGGGVAVHLLSSPPPPPPPPPPAQTPCRPHFGKCNFSYRMFIFSEGSPSSGMFGITA